MAHSIFLKLWIVGFLVGCFLFSPSSSRATAIFLAWTPKEIVVIADSLALIDEENGAGAGVLICKIRNFGYGYVAVSGYVKSRRTGYDVFRILEAASQTPGDLEKKVIAFESLIKGPYEKALNKRLKPGRRVSLPDPLAVSFFGIENGQPVLFNRVFNISISCDRKSLVTTPARFACPGASCPDDEATIILTTPRDDVRNKFKEENPNYRKGNFLEAGREFVQIHLDAKVPTVGPPIDELRITKQGHEWRGKTNRGCPISPLHGRGLRLPNTKSQALACDRASVPHVEIPPKVE